MIASRTVRRRAGAMFRALIVTVLVITLSVPAAEVAARWAGFGGPLLYYANSSYRYAPVPNQHVVRNTRSGTTIDGQGLRGTEPWSADADLHILFVGDGVTFGGTETDDATTFADRTCVELERRRGGNLVCGNAGVRGYGVDNMTARLRFDPAVAHADIVVVTIITKDATRGLADMGDSVYSVQPHGPLRALWEVSGNLLNRGATMLRYDYGNFDPRDDLRVLNLSLSELYSELRDLQDKGKRILVLFVPSRREVHGKEAPTTRPVRDNILGSGFSAIDLTEAMASPATDEWHESDGIALAEAGHELLATVIADALDEAIR